MPLTLGLALYAGPKTNYAFRLRVSAPAGRAADPPPASFEVARQSGASLVMEIARNGFPLRSVVVPAAEVFDSCGADGALRLWIKRQDDRLSFWVNGLRPLEFRDPFAIPLGADAVFAFDWPADVRVSKLSALRQSAAAAASPLDKGDALYEGKDYAGALASYQNQGVAAQTDAVREEARYKEGLCFAALNHPDDAERAFEDLAAGSGDVWPVLADCQLWRSFLQSQEPGAADRADLILSRLLSRGLTFERLAVLLPDDERARLLTPYLQGARWNLFADPERTLERLRKGVQVRGLLMDKNDPNYSATDLHLLLLLRMTGREDEALSLARTVLDRYKALDYTDLPRQILEQYTWMLRSPVGVAGRSPFRSWTAGCSTAPGRFAATGRVMSTSTWSGRASTWLWATRTPPWPTCVRTSPPSRKARPIPASGPPPVCWRAFCSNGRGTRPAPRPPGGAACPGPARPMRRRTRPTSRRRPPSTASSWPR